MSTSIAQPIFGRWSLASVDNKPASRVLQIGPAAEGIETDLADDSRKPVWISDIRPGGKYYSIVKLQIKFERQISSDTRWAQGTGWLIANDLVVTAGHCAFDHTYNFGKADKIRAYIGRKIVTTKEWIASDINRANDVSLILLDSPFNNAVPINYNPTAAAFKDWKLGVVGYPNDKTLDNEPGAQMYEMFKVTTCDLSKTSLNMLEYTISSGPGQSGSPVLIDGQNTSIGTNVYGLGTKNSASVIRGKYGNYYKGMVDALGSTEPPVATRNGIEYIKTTQPEDAIANEAAAASVVSTDALIISAVGSIADAIGGGAEDSFEPDSGVLAPHVEVLCHRALLGDAALHALMSVPVKDIQEESFFVDLVNTIKNIGSTVIKVAPTVIKTVTPIVQSLVGAMN
ncbi:glutamyl endopeptidase [Fusarium sp. NRRL 52700]|nr:glutamyl endopeptidase [Fusarium sp. NRRL 52700]